MQKLDLASSLLLTVCLSLVLHPMHACLVAQLCQTVCNLCSPQAPLSMGFFRQEYWGGLPFPPPRDLPGPGVKPTSPVYLVLQVDSLPSEPWGSPLHPLLFLINNCSNLLTETQGRSWRLDEGCFL